MEAGAQPRLVGAAASLLEPLDDYHERNVAARTGRGLGSAPPDEADDNMSFATSHDNADVLDLLRNLLGKQTSKLPVIQQRLIEGVLSNFKKDVAKHIKTLSHSKTLQDEIAKYGEMRSPASTAPYNVPYESPYLETVCNVSDEGIQFDLPAGTSLRDARKIIWFQCQKRIREIDLRVDQLKLAALKPVIKYEHVLSSCLVNAHDDAVYADLDLDLPPGLYDAVDEKAVLAVVQPAFKKVLEKVVADKRKLDAKAQKLKDDRDKVVKDATGLNPRQVITNAVGQALSEAGIQPRPAGIAKAKTKPKSGAYEFDYVGRVAASVAGITSDDASFVREKPPRRFTTSELALRKSQKNGQSRVDASGKTNASTPPDKSKGKGKGKDKGKPATPNPSQNAKGKGRDKSGKGVGKTPKGKGKGEGGKSKQW
jgi:hypothetical protein